MTQTFSILPLCQINQEWYVLLGKNVSIQNNIEKATWSDFSTTASDIDTIAKTFWQKTCCVASWGDSEQDDFSPISAVYNSSEHLIRFYHSYSSLVDLIEDNNYFAKIDMDGSITYILVIPYQKYISKDFDIIRQEIHMQVYHLNHENSFTQGPLELLNHPCHEYTNEQLMPFLSCCNIKWFSLSQLLIGTRHGNILKINQQTIDVLNNDFANKLSLISGELFN